MKDEWLSGILLKPAYHWQGPWERTPDMLAELHQKASEFFCDAKIPSEDVMGARHLQRSGFF